MGYTLRYFADAPLTLKAIGAGLQTGDPGFKIDGGELTHGAEMLGEIEINSAGSDLFGEELAFMIGTLERIGSPGARQVIDRLQRGTKAIVAVRVTAEGHDANRFITPIWPVLGRLSTGLAQIDGQGFYDGGTPIVAMP